MDIIPPVTNSSRAEINVPPDMDLDDEDYQYGQDGSFWEWDSDVQVAMMTTALVGLVLLYRVLSLWIRTILQRRAAIRSRQSETPEEAERTQRRINEALQETSHECPICLVNASQFPVLTDCGHIFCCECIIEYWRTSKAIFSPCDCAICRSTFHMLLPVRWPTDEQYEDRIHENNMLIDDYNRRFSNDRPALDYFRDIPILLPYLIRNLFQHRNGFDFMYQLKAGCMFVMLFVYFILPTDMIPESVYGVMGLLDDIILTLVGIGYLIRWFRNYMAERGRAPPA